MSMRGRSTRLEAATRNERDAIVQVWINRKDLATIGLFMESQGQRLLYMSDIVRFAIETTRALVLKANSPYVDSSAKATAFLETRFRVNLNPQGKGQKNYVANLLKESGEIGVDEVVPELPKALSPEKIREMKLKAQEQFRTSGNIAGDEILLTREEKDSKGLTEQQEAFRTLGRVTLDDEQEG